MYILPQLKKKNLVCKTQNKSGSESEGSLISSLGVRERLLRLPRGAVTKLGKHPGSSPERQDGVQEGASSQRQLEIAAASTPEGQGDRGTEREGMHIIWGLKAF